MPTDQPEQEIVDVGDVSGAGLPPHSRSFEHEPARIPPADQDAGEIGEPVPADGERADRDGDRIDGGKGDGEHGPAENPRGRGPSPPGQAWSTRRLAPTGRSHIC